MVRRRTPDASPWPALLALLLFALVGGGALWWVVGRIGGDEEPPRGPPPGLVGGATVSPFSDVAVVDGRWRLRLDASVERDPAAAAALVARARDAVAWVKDGRFETLYPEAAGRPREVVVRFDRVPPAGLVAALREVDEGLVLEDPEGRPVEKRVVISGPVPRVAAPGDARGVEHPGVVDLLTLDPGGEGITLTAYENRPWDGAEWRLDELDRKLAAYSAFVDRKEHLRAAGRGPGPTPVRIVLRCRHRPTAPEVARLARWRESLERDGIGFEARVTEGGAEEVLDLE